MPETVETQEANSTTKQTNKERLQAIVAGIEDGIQKLFQSDKYADYLRTMSRFHNYSVNNTVLIHLQKPDATLVAGYSQWKNRFSRHVKKGETGITIIAPTPFKKKVEEAKLDPDTREPLYDADGKPIVEERTVEIPVFKPVKVFDVAQTEGKPLPQLAADLVGDVQQYDAFMEALRRSAPVPIEFQSIDKSMDGYYSEDAQKIVIRSGMSQVQTVCAAIHEIGHSMLHNREQLALAAAAGTDGKAPKPKDKRTMEIEAESLSYSVCSYYNIETASNSFGYIASWSKDKTLPELRASPETITKTANALIGSIDKHFAEICKERGIALTAKDETEKESAALPGEALFQAGDKYLHIFRSEDVFAYHIYDTNTKRRFGGGWTKAQDAKSMRDICVSICAERGLDAQSIEAAPLKLLPELARGNTEKQDAPEQSTMGNGIAHDTVPEEGIPERFAADYCSYLERLFVDGVIENPFPSLQKEQVIPPVAEMLRDGDFQSVREILTQAHSRTGDSTSKKLLGQLSRLEAKWEASLTYEVKDYPLSTGEKDKSCVYFFQPNDPERQCGKLLFVGPVETCQKLIRELRDGTVTRAQAEAMREQWAEAQAREAEIASLPPQEALFLLDSEQYVHIRAAGKGFSYTVYNAGSLRLTDGGQFAAENTLRHPAQNLMEAACKEVCVREGLDPDTVETVPLEMLEKIEAVNALPEQVQAATEQTETTLDVYPVPDVSLSGDDLKTQGYEDGDLLPLSPEKAQELMEQDFSVYSIVDGGQAELCFDAEDIAVRPVDALFAVPREEWEESAAFREAVDGRMARQEEREQAFLNHSADCFAIYQVKHTDDLRFIRYESLESLREQGETVRRENYDLVYTAPLPEGATLDTLWEKFNIGHPADYRHPSMSVSDIVALKQGGVISCYYVDSVGFQELPDFLPKENYLKNAELAMEDDANMIDGIINNGPRQPSVEELEAQVKAGQSISLLDLANAVHTEKKEKKPEHPKMASKQEQPTKKQKTAHRKSAER